MSDYTTKATVELDVNGQKAKQELEQQRKLVKKLEIAYAKVEASTDKSANFLFETYNDAVFFRLRSSFWGVVRRGYLWEIYYLENK